MAKIIAICVSETKGIAKQQRNEIEVIENHGLKGDAHAGEWHRQVSLLEYFKIQEFRKKIKDVPFGAFGENFVIDGINLEELKIGDKLKIGQVELEITQIGKECHTGCNIAKSVGQCIMPKYGLFARVLKGGNVVLDEVVEKI